MPEQNDCGCVVHTGPHWLYEDDLWHARNLKLLEVIKDESKTLSQIELAFYAFCQEEAARLREKLWQMQHAPEVKP